MSELRVRVIAQKTERLFVELVMPGPFWPEDMALDIEVLYPNGETVRYTREIERVTEEEPDPPKPPPGRVTMQSLGRRVGKTLGSKQIITDMVQHHVDTYGWAIEYVYDNGVTGLLDPTKATLHFGDVDLVEAKRLVADMAKSSSGVVEAAAFYVRARKIMGQS